MKLLLTTFVVLVLFYTLPIDMMKVACACLLGATAVFALWSNGESLSLPPPIKHEVFGFVQLSRRTKSGRGCKRSAAKAIAGINRLEQQKVDVSEKLFVAAKHRLLDDAQYFLGCSAIYVSSEHFDEVKRTLSGALNGSQIHFVCVNSLLRDYYCC